MKSILGFLVVILLIIALYVGIISTLIFLLSLFPILMISINSWFALFSFSLYLIIWVIPYVLINIFQSIPVKNQIIKRMIWLISELFSVLLFALYVLFLDKHFVMLTFSVLGAICIIITILALTSTINMAGQRLKEREIKNH